MTEEEKTQAREYLTWLTESVAKLSLEKVVIERRLGFPNELLRLGETTIQRLPRTQVWEVPDVVHAVHEALKGSEDDRRDVLTALALVYYREFRETPPEPPQGEGNTTLWYH